MAAVNAEDLASLVTSLDRAGVSELVYRDGSETLTLRFAGAANTPNHATQNSTGAEIRPQIPQAKHLEILANASGAFTRVHTLDCELPLETIQQGDLVGYLTVDSVISAITAPANGRAGNQLVSDGKTVGYGEAVLELHDA